METAILKRPEGDISLFIVLVVTAIALLPLTAFTTYFHWADIVLFLGSGFVRGLSITAGYHRYLSHKAFKTNRVFQFILLWLGTTTMQGGPLWWAAHHRHHHIYSDQPEDIHSPKNYGFWYSHCLWFLYKRNLKAPMHLMRDFSKYPELRLLERYWYLSALVFIGILYLINGWNAVVWGFCVPTLVVNHITYAINSLVHVYGRRRYETKDTSRNNWFVAILAFGEGWHNNHHRYSGSVRQGFAWYEIDVTYYVLKVLSWFHIVYDLKPIPKRILEEGGLA